MKIATTFTKALTKALKTADRIQCRVNNDTKSVYVCTSYFLVKLNRMEYDALVRPIIQRDAGNYCIRDGEIAANQEPGDLEKLLVNAANESTHNLEAAPMTFDLPPHGRLKSPKLRGFYSESGDFVAALNSDYAAIVSGCEVKGIRPISPLVFYSAVEPIAMICPVKISDKPNIVNAVRAWFGAGIGDMVSKEDHEKAIAELERRATEAEEKAASFERGLDQTTSDYLNAVHKYEHLKSAFDNQYNQLEDAEREIKALNESLAAKAVELTETTTEPEEVQDTADETEAAIEADTTESGDVSDAVKERMESGTHSIKFFYNGIKVNGGKLIRCHYSIDSLHDGRECVSIHARDYGAQLPRDMFQVVNETDYITDCHDTDSAYVSPDHPLYLFVRAAAVSEGIRKIKRFLPKDLEKIVTAADRSGYYTNEAARKQERLAKLEAESVNLPKIKKQQPTAADVESVHALNLAAEHEKEIADREKVLNERAEGRRYIGSVSAKYPVREGEPVATIPLSENPAFYYWAMAEWGRPGSA